MKNRKKILYSLLMLLAGLIYVPVQAQQKKGNQEVVYQLDVKKSKLYWQAPKNQHRGFILFHSGTLSAFTAGHPTQGRFSINMNSMRSTGEPSAAKGKKVDDELRSEGFFSVSKYPAATIVVSKILPEPNRTTFKVYGKLTIKDVTKPIEFTTTMKQQGSVITARANLNINREEWKINLQEKPKTWNPLDSMKNHFVDNLIPVRLDLVFAKK